MADEKLGQQYQILKYASFWPFVASKDDIEEERKCLEAEHGCFIEVHSHEIVSRSGASCTRVEWRVI